MKFLNTIILIVCINYVSSQLFEDENKKFIVKQFPKKVQPGFYQINYSGKYVNPKQPQYESPQVDSKRAFYQMPLNPSRITKEQNHYTAFVPVNKAYPLNVPDSLFFPHNPLSDNKPRVKKVLPDHVWTSLREKRSADDKETAPLHSETKKTDKPVIKDEKKAETKEVKHEDKHHDKKIRKIKHFSKKSNATHGGKFHRVPRKKHRKLKVRNGPKSIKRHIRKKGSRNGTKTKTDSRRLISARDALIEQYPYVISIQKDSEHWCAGAILNPRLIITTANCLWKSSQLTRLRVRVGSKYTDQGGQKFKIQEVVKHPGWKIRRNPDCDVALALLDKNIRFSHSVHGVDLPNQAMLPAFDDAWVVSWGSERRDGIYDSANNALQVYHVRLMDRTKCNNITQRFGVTVTNNFICLAQTGRRAPCTRDTGAPAVSDGVLWGLASWGIRKLCGTERYPAMFTYLGSQANVDFITNATHSLMSEQRFYPYPDKPPRFRARES